MKFINPLLVKRLILVFFLSIGVFLFLIFNGYKYLDLDKINFAYERANSYIDNHTILASFSYACIYILTVFFSVPIKPFLKILAGLLFGLVLGFFICLFSATLGAMLAFLIIKYNWGEVQANPRFKIISRFKLLVENYPVSILLISRILPIPFFVPNILAGILKVKNSIFFLTTLIGIIPITFIYVWFGVHFKNSQLDYTKLFDYKFVLAVVILLLLTLLPFIFKLILRWKKSA
ncbi:TVP38/TMEM64 family protein [Francisella salina]|uniref:TVP38/TMEM64 family protein n=1 Tax=Francisella salina TaxID=573569 RepID=UPI0018DB1544|nr:VTT domain-containing protein [Francisella salina]